jgi:DNA polymerase III subunit gamma/tau
MPSLYRKWRSRSFEDLLGQDHVVRTLRNAVRQQRVAHAYLFTGPRGTGKTSAARILAKAVNCLDLQDGNPCNRCEACNAADEGRAMDVIEIDAASNTSVENVRDLRERVAYAAGEGRFKVYIVDEVHRLSGAAFDAFLKTLEEPPPHVIFVFASTEPHKVPATIASRCQRFEFRRIPPVVTLERLQHVSRHEAFDITEDALRLIALQSGGSLRDALGLLEQITSYAQGPVGEADARASLGLADPLLISRLTDHLRKAELALGLSAAAAFVDAGGDPVQLLRQLVDYWRVLLLQVTGLPPGELDMDPALRELVGTHAKGLDEGDVLGVLHALTSQEFSGKYNVPASLPFEVGYVEAAISLRGEGRRDNAPAPKADPAPGDRQTVKPVLDESAPRHSEILAEPEITSTEGASREEAAPPVTVAADDAQTVPEAVSSVHAGTQETWDAILERMRPKSPSILAVLRDGYLLQVDQGEVTIGFRWQFHFNQFADVKKRRLLEQVVSETLGSPHRVKCLLVTRADIEAARGAGVVVEDDGFVEEAVARLREYHIKQLNSGSS